jgi:hypothetical protein
MWIGRLKPGSLSMVSLECETNIAVFGNKRLIKSRNMGRKAPLALKRLFFWLQAVDWMWIACE